MMTVVPVSISNERMLLGTRIVLDWKGSNGNSLIFPFHLVCRCLYSSDTSILYQWYFINDCGLLNNSNQRKCAHAIKYTEPHSPSRNCLWVKVEWGGWGSLPYFVHLSQPLKLVGNRIVASLTAEDKQHLTELAHGNRHLCCPSRLIF